MRINRVGERRKEGEKMKLGIWGPKGVCLKGLLDDSKQNIEFYSENARKLLEDFEKNYLI